MDSWHVLLAAVDGWVAAAARCAGRRRVGRAPSAHARDGQFGGIGSRVGPAGWTSPSGLNHAPLVCSLASPSSTTSTCGALFITNSLKGWDTGPSAFGFGQGKGRCARKAVPAFRSMGVARSALSRLPRPSAKRAVLGGSSGCCDGASVRSECLHSSPDRQTERTAWCWGNPSGGKRPSIVK